MGTRDGSGYLTPDLAQATPGNARQYQMLDARQGGATIGGKRLFERTIGDAKLEILVNYYLVDMQRRGCTEDSIGTNRRARRHFSRSNNLESNGSGFRRSQTRLWTSTSRLCNNGM